MKIIMRPAPAMTAFLAAVSCGPQYVEPSEGSQTGFAISFFRNASKAVAPDENVIVSPYSAGVALSMLAEGAEGETRVEFDNVLNGSFFIAEDLGSNDTITVQSSNSVWISDDFSVRNRYVDLLQRDFDAFVTTQNFSDPATVHAINNWCSEHTSGKITEIIDRLSPDMVMVLINALYFNAPWEREFNPDATREAVFHGNGGDVTVPMMFSKAKYNYAEYQGCQMIELPYAGGNYSMFVVLPPAGMSPDALIPYISEHVYDSAMEMLAPADVTFLMPKYKLESSLLLNETLQDMGLKTAFTPAADFSGIAAMGPLKLDLVKQKCYIDVTEKGTEAAAVTSSQIRMTSFRPETRMEVNRPFIFFIANRETKDFLFAGRIVKL